MACTFARGIRNTMMAAAVLMLTACVAPSPAPTNSALETLEDGRSIEIAPGRTLWIQCAGEGSPTVILESGIHDSSDIWSEVALQSPAVGPDVFTALSEHCSATNGRRTWPF